MQILSQMTPASWLCGESVRECGMAGTEWRLLSVPGCCESTFSIRSRPGAEVLIRSESATALDLREVLLFFEDESRYAHAFASYRVTASMRYSSGKELCLSLTTVKGVQWKSCAATGVWRKLSRDAGNEPPDIVPQVTEPAQYGNPVDSRTVIIFAS